MGSSASSSNLKIKAFSRVVDGASDTKQYMTRETSNGLYTGGTRSLMYSENALYVGGARAVTGGGGKFCPVLANLDPLNFASRWQYFLDCSGAES